MLPVLLACDDPRTSWFFHNFGAVQTTASNLVQLPFRIHGEGHVSAFEYQALFDCGATATFGSKSLTCTVIVTITGDGIREAR